jgi:hypothetical protein
VLSESAVCGAARAAASFSAAELLRHRRGLAGRELLAHPVLHLRQRQLVRRRVGGHAAGGELAGADVDRLGVALVLGRVAGEDRLQELGVGERPGGLGAGSRFT